MKLLLPKNLAQLGGVDFNLNSDVAAGVLACRGGRASRRPERTIEKLNGFEIFQRDDRGCVAPPGGTPRLYGRRGRPPLHRQFPIPISELILMATVRRNWKKWGKIVSRP